MVAFNLLAFITMCGGIDSAVAGTPVPSFQPAALPKLVLGADNCVDMFGMGITVS